MEEKLTASRLRENIYTILDQVLETGVPVEIVRNGRTLRIVAEVAPGPGKLDRLPKRQGIVGDSDDIIHIDWSKEWSELNPKTAMVRKRK